MFTTTWTTKLCRCPGWNRGFSSTAQIAASYYDILGVRPDSTKGQIKSSFYRLSKLHHPDVSKDSESQHLFKDLTTAYSVLSNDRQRRAYDKNLPADARSNPHFRPRQTHDSHSHSHTDWRLHRSRGATHAWTHSQRTKSHPMNTGHDSRTQPSTSSGTTSQVSHLKRKRNNMEYHEYLRPGGNYTTGAWRRHRALEEEQEIISARQHQSSIKRAFMLLFSVGVSAWILSLFRSIPHEKHRMRSPSR